MKRNVRIVTIVTVVTFACSSGLLLVSCAEKQLITKQKEIEAPSKEAVKVEGEEPLVMKEEVTEAPKEEEFESPERVRMESLEELERAKKEEAEAKALQEREAVKFELESIYFDFDKSSIREEYRPILEKTAVLLKDNTTIHIRIEGNCDERGSPEYNLALGERRADSAKQFLVSLGVSPERIKVISYGEERPLAFGDNEEAWAQNRRDDFVIIKE